MRVDVPLVLVWQFLVVFARVTGIVAFLPLPGLKTPIDSPRILFALLLTAALFPRWPQVEAPSFPVGHLAALAIWELAIGVAIGLLMSLAMESFQFAAQLLAQQAGFSYASTIDPTNDTDSGVLLVLCQILTGFLAITAGLDRMVFRILLESLDRIPAGLPLGAIHLDAVGKLGARMCETGLLLALPSIAIFVVLDVLLAVLSRLEQQLQLTTILFPVKTACAMLAAAVALRSFPTAFDGVLAMLVEALRRVTG